MQLTGSVQKHVHLGLEFLSQRRVTQAAVLRLSVCELMRSPHHLEPASHKQY